MEELIASGYYEQKQQELAMQKQALDRENEQQQQDRARGPSASSQYVDHASACMSECLCVYDIR